VIEQVRQHPDLSGSDFSGKSLTINSDHITSADAEREVKAETRTWIAS
jgi:hypothetical protein